MQIMVVWKTLPGKYRTAVDQDAAAGAAAKKAFGK